MKATLVCAIWLVAAGAVIDGIAANTSTEVVKLTRAGNSWKKGQKIPPKLLEFRSSNDGFCFPSLRGTSALFGAITNYALLWEIAFLPRVDSRVFSNSVNQALIVAGPTRFFSDLMTTLRDNPELEKQERIAVLKAQSRVC